MLENLFRHREDRIPVAIFLSLTVLDFILYFTVENVWFLVFAWLLLVFPKGVMGAWCHHHQHCPTFRSTFLNRILDQCYTLHTGQSTNLWVLHHVLGHHHNYLDQTKDESRWKRKDGSTMGELEYSFSVTLTSYWRAFVVGLKHPKVLRTHLIYTAISFAIVGVLFYYKPMQAFWLFILPMFVTLFFTAWTTYDHHAGLDTDDHMDASYNTMNKAYNFLTGNLGYHTAHHYRQGVHWSKLPELHEELKSKIPTELYVKSTFDMFFPDVDKSTI